MANFVHFILEHRVYYLNFFFFLVIQKQNIYVKHDHNQVNYN